MQSPKYRRHDNVRWIPSPFLTVILPLLLLCVATAGCSGPTPEEVAERRVNDNIDLGAELLAEWIVGAGPVEPSSTAAQFAVKTGGDLIEHVILDAVIWDCSDARHVSGSWEVTATASVSLPDYAGFEEGLPLILRIEDQQVTDWRVDYMSAYARADILDMGSVVGAVSSISGVLGAEDCIDAARAGGVPDAVIEQLRGPASERSFMENAAIEAAIGAVELPEGCAESFLEQSALYEQCVTCADRHGPYLTQIPQGLSNETVLSSRG